MLSIEFDARPTNKRYRKREREKERERERETYGDDECERCGKREERETHSDNVEVVVVTECLQEFLYGFDSDDPPTSLHTPTGVHENHHVFRGTGGLDVPGSGNNTSINHQPSTL